MAGADKGCRKWFLSLVPALWYVCPLRCEPLMLSDSAWPWMLRCIVPPAAPPVAAAAPRPPAGARGEPGCEIAHTGRRSLALLCLQWDGTGSYQRMVRQALQQDPCARRWPALNGRLKEASEPGCMTR